MFVHWLHWSTLIHICCGCTVLHTTSRLGRVSLGMDRISIPPPSSSPCGSVSFLSVQLKLWSSLASSWTIVVNIVFICFPFGNQNRIKSDLKLLMSSNEHSLLLASKYSECVVCIRVKPQQRDFAFPHLPISRLDPTPEGWPLPPLLVCFLNCLEPENYLSGFAQLESCGQYTMCDCGRIFSPYLTTIGNELGEWVVQCEWHISFFDFHSAQPFHSWHFHTSRLLHWIGKCSKSTQNHSR